VPPLLILRVLLKRLVRLHEIPLELLKAGPPKQVSQNMYEMEIKTHSRDGGNKKVS
jgi:hypothetical protein